ncbi:MAG: DUF1631 family protein, partial [Kangiellaceae bacterium]|nr:DUF1631 family protein [Kangiellaceae bacterium]
LNEIAKLGIGWSPAPEGTPDPLWETITSSVDKVVTQFKSDIGLFDQLIADIVSFSDQDSRRYQILEMRMRQAEEGRAKAELAKQTIDEEIARISQNKIVPESVQEIIQEVWKNLLFVEYLKQENDDNYKKALKVIEFLLWSVQPKTSIEAKFKLKKIMPSLIKNIKIGMNKLSFDPSRQDQLLKKLHLSYHELLTTPVGKVSISDAFNSASTTETLQEIVADAKAFGQPTVTKPQTVPSYESILVDDIDDDYYELSRLSETSVADDDPIYQQVDDLQAGCWLELTKRNDETLKCKLAAHIASNGLYIFVNRLGVKLFDLTRVKLAVALKQRHLLVLDDDALFDKALESVITNLRSMKSA